MSRFQLEHFDNIIHFKTFGSNLSIFFTPVFFPHRYMGFLPALADKVVTSIATKTRPSSIGLPSGPNRSKTSPVIMAPGSAPGPHFVAIADVPATGSGPETRSPSSASAIDDMPAEVEPAISSTAHIQGVANVIGNKGVTAAVIAAQPVMTAHGFFRRAAGVTRSFAPARHG